VRPKVAPRQRVPPVRQALPPRTWRQQVRALRQHMGLTQEELARELNVRQQTVSEWETGQYRPRGASERLLSMVAERAVDKFAKIAPNQ